jgi:hypothetical protein
MRILTFALALALLAASTTACKPDPKKTVEQAMAFNEKVAELAEKHKDNCEAMTKAVLAAFEANKALLERAKKLKTELKPEQMKEIAQKQMARVKAYAPKMVHLSKCAAKSKKLVDALMSLK